MKDAVVKITDRHIQDGEEMSCELTTSGTLDFKPDGFTVTYLETDEELRGCTTTLKYSNGTLTMTRTGKYNTELIIEKDRRHTCFYQTPFGELMMGVYTKNMFTDMNENGGTLRFSYTIDFNNDLASENDLNITVAVKNQEV
ncbi:MAG: DUF1934 domain-containing protein [Clostridia bacterium]|nr:DUF1934 domain-containing protein [Clostridia bacterium]